MFSTDFQYKCPKFQRWNVCIFSFCYNLATNQLINCIKTILSPYLDSIKVPLIACSITSGIHSLTHAWITCAHRRIEVSRTTIAPTRLTIIFFLFSHCVCFGVFDNYISPFFPLRFRVFDNYIFPFPTDIHGFIYPHI